MVKLKDQKPYSFVFPTEEYEKKEEISMPFRPERIEYRERERPREITIERRTVHKMLREEELEPLRKVSPKVIGNLFDRVEFLRQRITETRTALETRKKLHEELMNEIEADIRDKQSMLAGLSNIDDVRDFKLDISTLRMEKRRECIQFWRDVFQLSTELRELMEQYETESKIANLFKDLQPGV
ncbi:MAG: hypothetical protein QMD36_03655 [Candidatus Aenigmarchaeota archaeon]|nr:hypothetical protein [Candidatus Aenigmarchaeota archaeon]